MTLDERAEKLFEEIMNPAHSAETCITLLRRALIEQDKITRHAAAEDITQMDTVGGFGVMVDKMQAHAAVMNCKGGVE